MKKNKIQTLIICAFALVSIFFSSCEFDVTLGKRLDLLGPVLNITAPNEGKTVPESFTMEGNVSDFTGVSELLIKAKCGSVDFAGAWRWYNGTWQISIDNGNTWSLYSSANTKWEGTVYSASWSIDIDLQSTGLVPEDGKYTFSVQAWDTAGFTDGNSFKTLVISYDSDYPIVEIVDPYLYDKPYESPSALFATLDAYTDTSDAKTDPNLIGKFITRGFNLQWVITDQQDLWSVEILFYDTSEIIDESLDTPLPANPIYRYVKNETPPPEIPDPLNAVRPNGSVAVPDLAGAVGSWTYPNGGKAELLNPISEKTSIQVVSVCYDAAANVNSEKVLGKFIYWPDADKPWIKFPDGMKDYNLGDTPYLIYPGRNVNVTAYQAHGVTKVEYEVFDSNEAGGEVRSYTANGYVNPRQGATALVNPPKLGSRDQRYSWEFITPFSSGNYILKAKAYGEPLTPGGSDVESVEYRLWFKVQDMSFPNFEEPEPLQSEPLYQHIGPKTYYLPSPLQATTSVTQSGEILLRGIISDATGLKSLYIVWINPQASSASISQLEYFRDSDYAGWNIFTPKGTTPPPAATVQGSYPNNYSFESGGLAYTLDTPGAEGISSTRNKVWRIDVSNPNSTGSHFRYLYQDPESKRLYYYFEQRINLRTHLNIAVGDASGQPLNNQNFLIRAENVDDKRTIQPYFPQGDQTPPKIGITNVTFTGTNSAATAVPGVYAELRKFEDSNEIIISGTWEEGSIAYLPLATYLTAVETNPNPDTNPGNDTAHLKVYINQKRILLSNNDTITITQTGGTSSDHGTWTVRARANQRSLAGVNLNDALVVSAEIVDIGKNRAESNGSWLVQTDTLRLLRIYSETDDGIYGVGKPVNVFMEFNKPVNLKSHTSDKNGQLSDDVVLQLSGGATARARYLHNNNYSTKQSFTYVVAAGNNTSALNVDSLVLPSGNPGTLANAAYVFSWITAPDQALKVEEIRIANTNTSYDPTDTQIKTLYGTSPNQYYIRRLPILGGSDNIYALGAGKNITIDTTAPTITGITATGTTAGQKKEGDDIFISVKFNEPVMIGTGAELPQLYFNNIAQSVAGPAKTSDSAANIRVNTDTGEIIFLYKVDGAKNDTTNGNAVNVTGFTGVIKDVAGNAIAPSGSLNTALTGIFIDTNPPPAPTISLYNAQTGGTQLNPAATPTIYVSDADGYIWLNVATSTVGGSYKNAGGIDYQMDNGTPATFPDSSNWIKTSSTARIKLTRHGAYRIVARQYDSAGNVSANSNILTFNWDPGALVTRIDSTTANGTYSDKTNPNAVNITVYLRKPIYSVTSSITLNARNRNNSNNQITLTGGSVDTFFNTLTFTYTIADGHYTPEGQALNVETLTVTAQDTSVGGTAVGTYISVPAAGNNNRLGERKTIYVSTGAITISPETNTFLSTTTATVVTNISTANDEWTGKLIFNFNRPVTKRDGKVTITQTGTYHLPAVLTEDQASRYRSIPLFDKYYKKGTNGFTRTGDTTGNPDTSAKYVLDFAQSAIQTPSIAGGATEMQQLAYYFRAAEAVELLVSSDDIVLSTPTTTSGRMEITLSGTNALPVLGGTYEILFERAFVQDSLGYVWPDTAASDQQRRYDIRTTGINRPFVRIDKRTNKDRVVTNTGSATAPNLQANFDTVEGGVTGVLQARARFDCRTPSSTIRYYQANQPHEVAADVSGSNGLVTIGKYTAFSGTATDPQATNNGNGTGNSINTNLNAAITYPSITANYVSTTATGGDGETSNGDPITIGGTGLTIAAIQGYTWRVAVRSIGNGTYSSQEEEVAFRTVLTIRIAGMGIGTAGTGQQIGRNGTSNTTNDNTNVGGDQLWIRGGDAVGSSSIPGYPLTYSDNFTALQDDQKRAGIRLMQMTTAGTGNMHTGSVWKWVSWEINVVTYFDTLIGRHTSAAAITSGGTPAGSSTWADYAAEAWQYGPRFFAGIKGGWGPDKESYPLVPGKHRFVHISSGSYVMGGNVNFAPITSWRTNGAGLTPSMSVPSTTP
jgi:hypothetical protein